jgi:hypothetical protein
LARIGVQITQNTQKHQEAIHILIKGTVEQLYGHKAKRAYPLFCGGGKTSSILGILYALHQLGITKSIVVAATQIEALCELKRSLVASGIPEEMIGLLHSKQFHPDKIGTEGYASLRSNTEEEIANRPFVLVTHNKVKHPKTWLGGYYYYQEKPRDLVIWDESLFSGEAVHISVLKLCNAIDSANNGFRIKFRGKPKESHYTALIQYLNAIRAFIHNAQDKEDCPISFPEPPLSVHEMSNQLDNLLENVEGKELIKLFECLENEGEIRYIQESQGAMIQFRQTLPEEIDNMVILDASHCLRELTQSDPTIETVKMDCPKSYENLTINFFKSSAGRKSLEAEFFKAEDSKLVEEITEIIISIRTQSPSEPILIWTYKAKGNKSIERAIKRRIQERDSVFNFDAVNEDGQKILNFQTFGNELGLNGFTHCKHSIFVGLLFLPKAYLAGMPKGLSRNMNREVIGNGLINHASVAEQAHIFYQAISRGSSRLTEKGKCKAHQVYFFHPKPLELKRRLEETLPNALWRRYEAIHIDNTHGLYYEIAKQINDCLNSLREEDFHLLNPRDKATHKVSTQALRKQYFPKIARHQWSNCIKVFKEEFPWEWEIKGQSFVRTGTQVFNR